MIAYWSIGSVSTADGSALVRLGDTTIVCGVKAEIAEPELDSPEQGFLGTSSPFLILDLEHPLYNQFRTLTCPHYALQNSSQVPLQTKHKCFRNDFTIYWSRTPWRIESKLPKIYMIIETQS